MSIFSKTPRGKLTREKYDLSYSTKFTMKTGVLYPVWAEEVAPGDIFNGGTGLVVRSQPTMAPIYQNYYMDIRYFYVPNRVLWPEFKEFMMDQKEGKAALEKPNLDHPYLAFLSDQADPGSIHDFFNVPQGNEEFVNALPYLAYYAIWNEYYRDQNLQDAKNPTPVGPVFDPTDFTLQRVNWMKDYFSSALPWTQRGQVVDMPADVILRGPFAAGVQPYQKVVRSSSDGWVPANWANTSQNTAAGVLRSMEDPNTSGVGTSPNDGGFLSYVASYSGTAANVQQLAAYLDPNGTLGVDINIRDLRYATAVQRFLEKEALVGGGRYADWMRGIYGVNIGDSTLQRPLYLGGGRNGINFSPVEQTSNTTSGSPQGNLAGKGYMSSLFTMNKPTVFAEHGWIMGMACIRPEALYCRGLNRHMVKRDRYDYLIPGFERLGEQEVYNFEVYDLSTYTGVASAAQAHEMNFGTFGYQSRQAEYKSHCGEIHGDMKASLRYYASARNDVAVLDEPIPLNSDFVECYPDEDNIFAVSPDVKDPWIVDGRNVVQCFRSLKKYPVYGL